MKIPKNDNFDILAEFKRKTDLKPEINIFEPEFVETPKVEINAADFDFIETITPESRASSETLPTVEEVEEERPPMTLEECKEEAARIVGFFDVMSVLFLPRLLRKKILSTDQYITAKNLRKRLKRDANAEIGFSEEELEIYEKLQELDEYEDDLPLTESEIKALSLPLGKLLHKWQKKSSSEVELALAVITIVAPKFLQFAKRR